MKLSKERRAELSALAEKATAGPWHATVGHVDKDIHVDAPDGSSPCVTYLEFVTDKKERIKRLADAKFIAMGRQALPDALADLDELEAKLADAVKALESIESLNERNGVESVTSGFSCAHISAWVAHELARRALAHLKA